MKSALAAPIGADRTLTGGPPWLVWHAMLQRNVTAGSGPVSAPASGAGTSHRHKAHAAHAAVVGLHSLCCGAPALAMVVAAVSGAASGATVLPSIFSRLHDLLHANEIWILVVSASLVSLGGLLELNARRAGHGAKGFPLMFAISLGCFALNVAIIAGHRLLN